MKEKDGKKRNAKEESDASTATTPVVKEAAPAAVVHSKTATATSMLAEQQQWKK